MYGTLDSRKQTAKWVARWFTVLPLQKPGVTADEIIETALRARYATARPDLLTRANLDAACGREIKDARDLCHLIADYELLNHLTPHERETFTMGGRNIVVETYRVMDKQLEKMGL